MMHNRLIVYIGERESRIRKGKFKTDNKVGFGD